MFKGTKQYTEQYVFVGIFHNNIEVSHMGMAYFYNIVLTCPTSSALTWASYTLTVHSTYAYTQLL